MAHTLASLALLLATPALAADPGPVDVGPGTGGPDAPRPDGTWFFTGGGDTLVGVEETPDGLLLNGAIPAWRTGEVLIGGVAPDTARAVQALPEVAYIDPIHPHDDVYLVTVGEGVDDIALSVALLDRPDVGWSHPNLGVELVPHTLDDPLLGDAWYLDNTGQRGGIPGVDVSAFEAWETATGDGQIIAIVDTGIDMGHPDLDVLPDGADFGSNDTDPSPDVGSDGHGHGTAMAGVAAAIGNNGEGAAGVAPDAQILAVKIFGRSSNLLDVHDAFVYAADQGAAVLSNSWGFSATECPRVPLPGIIVQALLYVEENGRGGLGAAVPMSYGNAGCDASADEFHNHPWIITVGAASDEDRKIGYSNFGSGIDIMGFAGGDGRPGLITTDVRGGDGYSGNDYWYGGSGTSSACASVAGVLALMFEANPRLTAAEARAALCDTAVKPAWDDAVWDEDGWSDRYGCGRIDAAAAVSAVADAGPPVLTPDDPGTQRADRVVLSWTVADPDDDTVRVDLTLTGPDGDEVVLEGLTGTSVTVTDQVGPGAWSWRLSPADAWGPGDDIEGPPLTVVVPEQPERPEAPAGGCTSVGATPALPLLLWPLLIRRRRRH